MLVTSTETLQRPYRPLGMGSPGLKSRRLWSLLSFRFNVALHLQRPYRPFGTGSPGHPPLLSRISWALTVLDVHVHCCFTSTETVLLGMRSPGRPSQLSHSSWALRSMLPGEATDPYPCPYDIMLHLWWSISPRLPSLWDPMEWPLSLPLWHHIMSLTKCFLSACDTPWNNPYHCPYDIILCPWRSVSCLLVRHQGTSCSNSDFSCMLHRSAVETNEFSGSSNLSASLLFEGIASAAQLPWQGKG